MSTDLSIDMGLSEAVAPESGEMFAFPLTRAQAAMWPRHTESTWNDSRFNGSFRMNLAGRVSMALLQASLREIADRHEALRAVFQVDSGQVLQIIQPKSDLTVLVIDLRPLAEPRRMEQMEELCAREARQPFDLTQGPPIRANLIQMEDERSILTLTIHQIVCDGWSVGLLMEELSSIYSAFAAGRPSTLAPLDFQFGDYVIWQEEHASGADVERQLAYWKKKLAGYSPVRIASDFESASDSIESGIVSRLLPRALTDELKSLGQAQNATFFVVAMAACMAVAQRYTGSSDIALRTPLAGRTRVEFEPIIGQFVNHVVVRASVSSNLKISELIKSVREGVWEALANQDVAFERVLEGTQADPTEDRYPINFVCQREYGRSGAFQFDFDGVTMTTMPSKSQGALYDLNFFLVEREAGWRLSLEYKTALYSQETAESLLQHFNEILSVFAAKSEQALSEIPLTETAALLNRTKASVSTTVETEADAEEGGGGVIAMPASLAQERFWTLSQIDPANPTFHIPLVMQLSGEVSGELLQKSFQVLVDRHETLRTTFSEIDNRLMQIISPTHRFAMDEFDLAEFGDAEKESRLEELVQSVLKKPFDLSTLPLFRARLCHLGHSNHVLVLSLHHVNGDAWSMQVLQRELWTVYEQLRRGETISLPPLTLQYGDFSVWQQEELESQAMKTHLDFWLKSLAGDLPVLDFPTDRAPAYKPATRGAISTLLLPDELTRSLKEFAQSSDVTLFVLALACFAVVVARGANAEDVVFGSPAANRRPETENLIGPFAGPVPLRMDLSGDPSLRSLLTIARDRTLDALDHTELPFEALLERLNVRPAHGRNPLFQFYFFCQPAFVQSRKVGELEVTPLATVSLGIPFELQLGVIERAEGIRAELEYNPHLYDRSTIEDWLHYYQIVLETLVLNPELKISELPTPPHQSKISSEAAAKVPLVSSAGSEPTNNLKADVRPALSLEADELEKLGQDPLVIDIRDIWESSLGKKEIGIHDDFFAIGGRSLVAARLITKINRKYSLSLGLATLFSFPTIVDLAQLIRGEMVRKVPSSIIAIQPKGTQTPLFLIHGVGGNVLNFYDLAQELGEDQPAYGIEAHALNATNDPLTTLEDLAAYYIREVRKIQPAGPYRFLGYSYGGFLSFEMARQLQAVGEVVELVGMLDTPIWRHSLHAAHSTAGKMWRQFQAVWLPFFQRMRPLTPKEIFDALKSTIIRSYYTAAVSRGKEIHRLLRTVYHLNSFAAVNYIPKSYIGRVTILRASAEPGPRDLGWGAFTTEPAEIYEVPGAHLQVLSEKNLPLVVKSLRHCFASRKNTAESVLSAR